jgi:hypothetical protein
MQSSPVTLSLLGPHIYRNTLFSKKGSVQVQGFLKWFLKWPFLRLLTPRQTPKQEDLPWSAVRCCLFNIFAATLHIGDRSSIRNLRTRHTLVSETHLSRNQMKYILNIFWGENAYICTVKTALAYSYCCALSGLCNYWLIECLLTSQINFIAYVEEELISKIEWCKKFTCPPLAYY